MCGILNCLSNSHIPALLDGSGLKYVFYSYLRWLNTILNTIISLKVVQALWLGKTQYFLYLLTFLDKISTYIIL